MRAQDRYVQRKWFLQPLYLMLLPFFTLGHAWNGLFGFVSASMAVHYLLLAFLVVAISWMIVFALTRNTVKASAITFCIVLVFLFYGNISNGAALISPRLSSFKVLPLLLLLIAIATGSYWSAKASRERKISAFINWLLLLFILTECGTGVYQYATYRRHQNRIYTSYPLADQYRLRLPDSSKPDIFLLVMDEYAGPHTLQRLGFNNQPFLDSLRRLGLWVAPESRSNYDFTPFSVSSLLQMDYMDRNLERRGNDAPTVLRAIRSISDNQVVRILQKEGYDIRYEVPFDNSIQPKSTLNEFGDFPYKQVFGNTFIGRLRRERQIDADPLSKFFAPSFNYGDANKRREDLAGYREGLRAAIDSQATRRPRFVYQHLLITHHPYLFGPTGRPRERAASAGEETSAYLEQVRYANKVLLEQVASIRAQGRRNTVILLLSDHGYRSSGRLEEAFENLYGLYFPDGNYQGLGQSPTPVNAFRMVFNHCLGQHWPLLPDRSIPVKYE